MEENLKTEQFQDIIHSLNHLVLSQELFVLGANPGSESILEDKASKPSPSGSSLSGGVGRHPTKRHGRITKHGRGREGLWKGTNCSVEMLCSLPAL